MAISSGNLIRLEPETVHVRPALNLYSGTLTKNVYFEATNRTGIEITDEFDWFTPDVSIMKANDELREYESGLNWHRVYGAVIDWY